MVYRSMQETIQKKRRGPKPTGKGEQIQVRLQPELLNSLDEYISTFDDPKLTRPEAIRRILTEKLRGCS